MDFGSEEWWSTWGERAGVDEVCINGAMRAVTRQSGVFVSLGSSSAQAAAVMGKGVQHQRCCLDDQGCRRAPQLHGGAPYLLPPRQWMARSLAQRQRCARRRPAAASGEEEEKERAWRRPGGGGSGGGGNNHHHQQTDRPTRLADHRITEGGA